MPGTALEGIRVLDFTWYAAGPIGTQYLSDFGAEVTKVESPRRPDMTRLSGPYRDGVVGVNNSGFFLQKNTGKRSLALDLSTPPGLEVVRKLVPLVDVVVENFSPRVMEKMGLGYEELRSLRPDIIMASCSIQGRRGQAGQFLGFGPATIALADYVSPLFTVVAIMAALDHRRRTGKGAYIDVAQVDLMVQFLSPVVLDYLVNGREARRMGNRHPLAAPHGAFRCRGEDRWCVIAVFTEEQWHGLSRAVGGPPWAHDARFATLQSRKDNEDELERLVEEWTRTRSAEEVMEAMQRERVPAGVVPDARDIMECDPQIRARGALPVLEHPVVGPVHHLSSSIKLSKTPAQMRTAPCLGADTGTTTTWEPYDLLFPGPLA